MRATQFDRLTIQFSGQHRFSRKTFMRGAAAVTGASVLGGLQLLTPAPAGAICGAFDDSLKCSVGEKCCYGVCTNVHNNSLNCGSCGNACSLARGERCIGTSCMGSSSSSGSSASSSSSAPTSYPIDSQYTSPAGWTLGWASQLWAGSQLAAENGWAEELEFDHRQERENVFLVGGTRYGDYLTCLNDQANYFAGRPGVTGAEYMVDSTGQPIGSREENAGWLAITFTQTASDGIPYPTVLVFVAYTLPGPSVLLAVMHTLTMFYNTSLTAFFDLLQAGLNLTQVRGYQ